MGGDSADCCGSCSTEGCPDCEPGLLAEGTLARFESEEAERKALNRPFDFFWLPIGAVLEFIWL